MLRNALLILITLTIAIGGGAGSVWYALGAIGGLGAVHAGVWTAFPDAGTPQSDPYSRARVARDAELPLGRAEGLSFVAERDASGERLSFACTYRIEGLVPPARFFTLHAADEAMRPAPGLGARPPGLTTYDLLRLADGSLAITASAHVQPGNWLALSGSGPMALVLTLYDTSVASGENVSALDLPQLFRVGCDG